MDFSDSDSQKLLRSTTRSFLANRYPWDRLFAIERMDASISGADVRELADLGWLSLLSPESAGGAAASLLDTAIVIDEFGFAAVPCPVSCHNLAALLLGSVPASAEAHDLLGSLAKASQFGTVSESARRDSSYRHFGPPDGITLTAQDGVLNGTLTLVPFADLAQIVLAPVLIDGQFAFASIPLHGTAIQPTRLFDVPNYFAVRFDQASMAAVRVLATGSAAEALRELADVLITAFGVMQLAGVVSRILEMTTEYITQRVQFGRPIATFQAARHRDAEILMQCEGLRWTAYHALWRIQQNISDTEGVWLAKHWAIRAAERVFVHSHMLHGGVGEGIEYPLHLFTNQLVGLAVRGGGMDEMVARVTERGRASEPSLANG